MQLAVQLYSLRHLETSLLDLLELVSETPFEGVEFAGLDDTDPKAVAETLGATELEPVAAHVAIEDLEADSDAVAETYRRLGCNHLVVPWLEPDRFETRTAVRETAGRLATLGEALADHDVTLSYHNHDQEFVSLEPAPVDGDAPDGTTANENDAVAALDVLAAELENSPVGFELDLGWTVAAGGDPMALLERYGDRIELVHLKDVDGDRPCALGDGDVPLEACVDAARDADVEWLIYEHDDPTDPKRALQRDGARASALRGE